MDNQTLPLIVKNSGKRILLLSLLPFILSIPCFFGPEKTWGVAVLGILLGLLLILYGFHLNHQILLSIDSTGITAYPKGKAKIGPVLWEDIIDIRIDEHRSSSSTFYYLTADVANPEQYFEKFPKAAFRMQYLNRQLGLTDENTVFRIPVTSARPHKEEILKICKSEQEKHKNATISTDKPVSKIISKAASVPASSQQKLPNLLVWIVLLLPIGLTILLSLHYKLEEQVYYVLFMGSLILSAFILRFLLFIFNRKSRNSQETSAIITEKSTTQNTSTTQLSPWSFMPKSVRIIGTTIIVVAALFLMFGGNQLTREGLHDQTTYAVTLQDDKNPSFVFSVVDEGNKWQTPKAVFYGAHDDGTQLSQNDIYAFNKAIKKSFQESSPRFHELTANREGLTKNDNFFDTDIKTSKYWDKNNYLEIEFDKGYCRLSNFKSTKNQNVQTATLCENDGISVPVTVTAVSEY